MWRSMDDLPDIDPRERFRFSVLLADILTEYSCL